MKVYAIYAEYGAGCIHEEIHMLCKTKKLAQQWYDAIDLSIRVCRIEPVEIETKPPQKTKTKKKKKK